MAAGRCCMRGVAPKCCAGALAAAAATAAAAERQLLQPLVVQLLIASRKLLAHRHGRMHALLRGGVGADAELPMLLGRVAWWLQR